VLARQELWNILTDYLWKRDVRDGRGHPVTDVEHSLLAGFNESRWSQRIWFVSISIFTGAGRLPRSDAWVISLLTSI
jgi:hypothetical protein